ncbi:hypothetical protein JHK86_033834 [Glycine max]|nr:hypothetical protein JHK86_033834 [Glycine max]
MHELGSRTSGINSHDGPTRNPYDTNKIAGGSSSGSASLVSVGLCPIALGVDWGGSVTMSAALCGVVGLNNETLMDLTFKPKYLVTFTVGYEQKKNIDVAVKKFSKDFTILLFHYDGRTTEWDEFEWSKQAIHAKINLPRLSLTKSISDIKLAKYRKLKKSREVADAIVKNNQDLVLRYKAVFNDGLKLDLGHTLSLEKAHHNNDICVCHNMLNGA